MQLYFNIWANISYGYVGRAAGFSAKKLQSGAELNAKVAGTNTMGNWWGRQIGIDLYAHHPILDSLSPTAIDNEIRSHLPNLRPYSEYQPYPATIPLPPRQWVGGPPPND